MTKEHELNKMAWNEAAAFYKAGLKKSIELLKQGKVTFLGPEIKILNKYKDQLKMCVHLQCAGGTDTLSGLRLNLWV
ncbi:MAG: hypothetical protein H6625_02800 [Bdellovibrionaceae bacterium]|nr:hypothetical protein [Pseudobdellovibrionaceae bacterium]